MEVPNPQSGYKRKPKPSHLVCYRCRQTVAEIKADSGALVEVRPYRPIRSLLPGEMTSAICEACFNQRAEEIEASAQARSEGRIK